LIAVESKGAKNGWSAKDSLEELAALALSAGAQVVGKVSQRLDYPSRSHYLGKGKLEEVAALKETLGYDLVIVDDELSPEQQANLEEAFEARIVDRIALILDIFARRARTHEGKLQVELAQYEYLLPRLAGKWLHLERLGAGIGTRGPGESQLETDRRLMRQKMTRLKKQIEDVRKHRQLYRLKRQKSGIPVIALVGYTNSGKSTLLNALGKSTILAKDELFSTLDPTTRRIVLPDNKLALLTDTVGFIKKLPPSIITAFRATLEEISDAALLVHVVDFSSPNAAEQCNTVEEILTEMEIAAKPRITALNKIDLLLNGDQQWDETKALEYIASRQETPAENTILISAIRRWGLNQLREIMGKMDAEIGTPPA
jgi:GTPase